MLVPVGCWDAYAYDDTYWYLFVNIKENANAAKELSKTQAYTLKNAATRSYLVYDPVNDAVGSIELDANINEDNPNHNWQMIEQKGETYIYSIGAKKYLTVETVNASAPMRSMAAATFSTEYQWGLSATPVPIALTDGAKGINIGTTGDWLFVLNEQMNVDQNASGIEELVTVEISTDRHDLSGRKVQEIRKGELYIQSGKKVVVK